MSIKVKDPRVIVEKNVATVALKVKANRERLRPHSVGRGTRS
jgi:hypothetical protein